MASRAVENKENLNLPKTFKEVARLSKPKLKEICSVLSIDLEKSVGKKALINIVCSALKISTSGTDQKDAHTTSLHTYKSIRKDIFSCKEVNYAKR